MALGIIPAFIWIGGALISSGVIARWWRETGPEDVAVVGKYISDPSQFTSEVPMPGILYLTSTAIATLSATLKHKTSKRPSTGVFARDLLRLLAMLLNLYTI